MPQYLPDPDLTQEQLVEDLGASVAELYNGIEVRLQAELARRLRKGLENYPTLLERLRVVRELDAYSQQVMAGVNAQDTATQLINIATQQGSAAAAAWLGLARHLPRDLGLTTSSVHAAIMLRMDLTNKLEALNQRILRYDSDAYQRIVAAISPDVLTGTTTLKVTQAQIVQKFLSEGITGFVDKANRRWRIGSYAEMAARTATQRAWQDANIFRLGQSGIHLVDVITSISACPKCAPWAGKILSTNGATGTVQVTHALTGKPVSVHIDATLEEARASGWGHPNDRCTLAGYLPGVSALQDPSTLDPEKAEANVKLRELERDKRQAKRDIVTAMTDIQAARARRDLRDAGKAIREHVAATGVTRKPYREQLHFSDGGFANPHG